MPKSCAARGTIRGWRERVYRTEVQCGRARGAALGQGAVNCPQVRAAEGRPQSGEMRCSARVSGRGAGSVRVEVESVTLEVAIETGAADTEYLGGAQAVAIAHLKNFLDMMFADFVEGKRAPVFVRREERTAMLEILGEIADINEVSGSGDAAGGDYVFEFADVSRPGMLE